MNEPSSPPILWQELDGFSERLASGPVWRDQQRDVRVLFAGCSAASSRPEAIKRLLPAAVAASWLDQVHSADLRVAAPVCCGVGDGLLTDRAGLALAIATADCVPVLLAGGPSLAAVHAGWRGIAQNIVGAAVERLEAPGAEVVAWIGPAIGPQAYEVGEEVAQEVAAVSGPQIVLRGLGPRPHLDLQAAVAVQLDRAGVSQIRCLRACTYERATELYSYRRSGPRAGRNLSLIWR